MLKGVCQGSFALTDKPYPIKRYVCRGLPFDDLVVLLLSRCTPAIAALTNRVAYAYTHWGFWELKRIKFNI